MNSCLGLVHRTLPRLLALFDTDSSRSSYGMGDRYHWAWGLIDFGNGTFQGAANGLARLVREGLLPEGFDEAAILNRIDAMFVGADALRRRDGSLEEAFPYESSYCVTALVAYDLLSAIELLEQRVPSEERELRMAIVRPMIACLCRSRETHAIISNHLGTAVAALVKWQKLSGEATDRFARQALAVILEHQSEEGWFDEYGGADPGYQSLCTYYLADVHRMRPDLGLLEPLRRSLTFLWHFVHPDGSFGGLYGSRNTRFYYPAGVEYLAREIPEAAALAKEMRSSVEQDRVVTLAAMDEANLTPMFNAYCWAASIPAVEGDLPQLPCHGNPFRKHWPDAGIVIDRGINHYTVISTHKGGVCSHFVHGRRARIDAGVLARDPRGVLFSSQIKRQSNPTEIDGKRVEIRSSMRPVTRRRQTPLQFVALRLLNLSVMRNAWIREKVKQWLVRRLIRGGERDSGQVHRVIEFGENLSIVDRLDAPGLTKIEPAGEFVAIHMGSQGYWQCQDDGER
ncbi:hypothetical protein ACFL6X_01695 [Candidatus Latescibacterota bacterium]